MSGQDYVHNEQETKPEGSCHSVRNEVFFEQLLSLLGNVELRDICPKALNSSSTH